MENFTRFTSPIGIIMILQKLFILSLEKSDSRNDGEKSSVLFQELFFSQIGKLVDCHMEFSAGVWVVKIDKLNIFLVYLLAEYSLLLGIVCFVINYSEGWKIHRVRLEKRVEFKRRKFIYVWSTIFVSFSSLSWRVIVIIGVNDVRRGGIGAEGVKGELPLRMKRLRANKGWEDEEKENGRNESALQNSEVFNFTITCTVHGTCNIPAVLLPNNR